ncbi:MAG: hypothetical protein MI922_13850 [Bacteroidales bacterium]|nr:hypothetical protein [Bacteroidales bacterium]
MFYLSTLFFVLMVFWSFYDSYRDVKDISVRAKNVMGDSCIPALINYYKSIYCVPDDKINVVFALGQFADAQALPFLYGVSNTNKCNDTALYNTLICYETTTAMVNCMEGHYTKWLYRNRENW